jgi:hypothetical protein
MLEYFGRSTKKLLVAAAVLAIVIYGGVRARVVPGPQSFIADSNGGETAIVEAFRAHRSNIQVQAEGRVSRILSDDHEGSRHQRFIVKLPSGQTVLISHNIDIASRVATITVGDRVEFSGEYEWNEMGGVVHWTHQDLNGKHVAGWIKHDGRIYQ